MRITFLRITAFVLLVTGSFLLSDGCWIRAKAVLAQILLQHAWEETLQTGRATKPWPWADTWPVARLRMDRLGIDLIVLEGESGEVLAFGPGHLPASDISGGPGNCILSGHRDTSFSFLRNLTEKDVLSLQIGDGSIHKYQVNEMFTRKAEKLYLQEVDRSVLTLITCYPFETLNPGTKLRYVVFADRMPG
jgi:sortase A